MTVTRNEEFAKRMMLMAQPPEQFRPTALRLGEVGSGAAGDPPDPT